MWVVQCLLGSLDLVESQLTAWSYDQVFVSVPITVLQSKRILFRLKPTDGLLNPVDSRVVTEHLRLRTHCVRAFLQGRLLCGADHAATDHRERWLIPVVTRRVKHCDIRGRYGAVGLTVGVRNKVVTGRTSSDYCNFRMEGRETASLCYSVHRSL